MDLEVDHRFSFGDLVCYPLEKDVERRKFDLKNEVGFYMGDDLPTKDSVYIYRPFYHDLYKRAGAARVDVSEIQLLRWYSKRVDVRKPTITFGEFKNAALELLPVGYEEAEKYESPAIIAPDLVDEAALYAGEDSEHADEEDSSGGDDSEVAQESADGATPAPGRLIGKKRSRKDKRRRTREPGLAASDRIVLPVETKPFGPRELRRQPTVDYRRLNKGEYVGIRTISCVKACLL